MRRSLPRRILLSGCVIVLAWLVVEGLTSVLLWTTHGGSGPVAWIAQRSESARQFASEQGEQPASKSPALLNELTLHPFLGFVRRPETFSIPGIRQDPDGFFEADTAKPPRSQRFTVGLVGGSVAFELGMDGRHALVDELSRLAAARGKTVWLEVYAFKGYKQPQQLMALSYLLAMERRPDVLINLDGLNEVILPVAENLAVGVNPFYPRAWRGLVEQLPAPDRLRDMGEMHYLAERRRKWAAVCNPAPLRWSAICHVAWRSYDSRLRRRVSALEQQLTLAPAADRSFRVIGPPYAVASDEALYRDLARFWARCSVLMQRISETEGIAYFHFLQPNQRVAAAKPMGPAERRIALPPDALYRVPAERGYPFLIAEGVGLTAAGVNYTDLTQMFASVEEPVYRDACCHFNQRGYDLLAREIGRVIVGRLGAAEP